MVGPAQSASTAHSGPWPPVSPPEPAAPPEGLVVEDPPVPTLPEGSPHEGRATQRKARARIEDDFTPGDGAIKSAVARMSSNESEPRKIHASGAKDADPARGAEGDVARAGPGPSTALAALGARPPVAAERAADVFLERSLLVNFVIHAIAMVTMALVLARMLPGGGEPDPVARVASIAAHPWLFRLGWLPWQLCAAADLWLAIAFVRVRWMPKWGSLAVLVLTIAAVIPDQYAQAVWVTKGVRLAEEATSAAGLNRYLDFEGATFVLTAAWGAVLYTLAAIGWTVCLWRARLLSRLLLGVSCVAWTIMLFVTTVLLVPPELRIAPEAVALGNALGFVLLEVWLALATEAVLRRRRPIAPFGRDALWRHPWEGMVGRALDVLANSRFAGAFLEPLPAFAMVSDITDVVYVNYLLPVDKLLHIVPKGLSIQRLGPGGRYGLFTFLTYRHGHFGFRLLGPLRRLMPSPVQTNWRVHVEDPRTGQKGIFFLTNAIASTALSLGARMLTEGMPMHVLKEAEIQREEDGTIRLLLEPGGGSAPDAKANLRPGKVPVLEGAWRGAWRESFGTFRDFLAYAVPQDRAMSTQPSAGTVTRQEIDLGIPLDICEPLEGEVVSRAAEAIAGDAKPVCFRVPKVFFRFEVEEKDPLPSSPDKQ